MDDREQGGGKEHTDIQREGETGKKERESTILYVVLPFMVKFCVTLLIQIYSNT